MMFYGHRKLWEREEEQNPFLSFCFRELLFDLFLVRHSIGAYTTITWNRQKIDGKLNTFFMVSKMR